MRRIMTAASAAAAMMLATGARTGPPVDAGGTQTAHAAPRGSYPYLVYLPVGYAADPARAWPLVLFLHGSGERGTDIALVKRNGPPKRVETLPDTPYILVSPQLEAGGRWDDDRLDALLTAVRATFRVDASRIYLTGLSLGAIGAWEWAMRRPELFAALVPVAGRGEPSGACRLKDMPVWAFHGDADPVVDPVGSFSLVQAVRACRGSVAPRLTIYPAIGHASWDPAYDDPALWRWLLEQRRAVPAPLQPTRPDVR